MAETQAAAEPEGAFKHSGAGLNAPHTSVIPVKTGIQYFTVTPAQADIQSSKPLII